jgi:hypothetical protein
VKVSVEFYQSFRGYGGAVVNCQCGRTHFAGGGEFEGGEIEELRLLAKEKPDDYIEHNDDGYVGIDIDGLFLVCDCPCDRAGRYEAFIWEHREGITAYLTKRVVGQISAAVIEARVAATLNTAMQAPYTASKIAAALKGEA